MASDPAQFLCGECGKGFVDEVKLGLHHYSVHAEKPFECTHCGEKGKIFCAKRNMKRHVNNVHNAHNATSRNSNESNVDDNFDADPLLPVM